MIILAIVWPLSSAASQASIFFCTKVCIINFYDLSITTILIHNITVFFVYYGELLSVSNFMVHGTMNGWMNR